MKKKTKFSLGIFDNELQEQEIQVPDGYEASIEGGKIIFRKSESEDEKIRKKLVEYFKGYKEHSGFETLNKIPTNDILAWLEKQSKCNPYSGTSFEYNGHTWGICARDNGVEITLDGELKAFLSLEKSFIYPIHPQPSIESIPTQNITNETKIKSKFHGGDWITNKEGVLWQIDEVRTENYLLIDSDGILFAEEIAKIDSEFHLWTILDAKDGDVLTCYSTKKGEPIMQTGIFKQYVENNCFLAYIGIDWDGNLKTDFYMGNTLMGSTIGSTDIFPATKGWREYFFTQVKCKIS